MKKHEYLLVVVLLTLPLVGSTMLFGCASEEQKSTRTEVEDSASNNRKDTIELQIFASNSLTEALSEVQELYAKTHDEVIFASARYLESDSMIVNLRVSVHPDLFVADSRVLMNSVEDEKLVDMSAREDVFSTDLVIVAKRNSGLSGVSIEDIAAGTYTVALEDEATLAGSCAAQSFSTIGAYQDPTGKTGVDAVGQGGEYVEIQPQIGMKISDVCALVEEGKADTAIIRNADACRFEGVEVVGSIPPDSHKRIVYSAAVCMDSKYPKEITEFLMWTTTDSEALKVWEKWGFDLLA